MERYESSQDGYSLVHINERDDSYGTSRQRLSSSLYSCMVEQP